MPVARTNWHSDLLPTLELEDPFEVPVESVGKPIDLSGPKATLLVRVQELMHREGQLDALGITCSLKERVDVICSVCPVSEAENGDSRLGELCRVSREQEVVVTQLAVEANEAQHSAG